MKAIKFSLLLSAIALTANAASFTVSFGDGGFKNYKVIDNICYGYAIPVKENKTLVKMINQAVTLSVSKAKKSYAKKAKGFINIKFHWAPLGQKGLLYQICGDVVK
jgi:hypothetical protein